ncbi:MAG: hypothetical protein ACI88H_004311, partial [Cocleimonas sp.]
MLVNIAMYVNIYSRKNLLIHKLYSTFTDINHLYTYLPHYPF